MDSIFLKRILLLGCLSLLCVTGFAEVNGKSPMPALSRNSVNVEIGSNGAITIELTLEDYDTIPVLIGSDRYYMITMPEGHSPLMKGDPDLPVITKSFIIPENSAYTVRVIEESFTEHTIPVAPSLGSIRRNQSWNDVQIVFSDAYSRNSFYPTATVIAGEPYHVRDVQGGNIQICPFKYNPVTNTLRAYNHLKVEISFPDYNLRGDMNNDKKVVNSHFYPLIKHKFVNTDYYVRNESEPARPGEPLRSLDETAAKMLVICCDSFVTEMRNFIIHKNNMGLPTTLVKMSDVGTTANHLKTYIQNAYNADNDLTYVLLVGDTAQVPAPIAKCLCNINQSTGDSIFYYGAADPLLSLVDGNDNYPDIVVGRFSAETKCDVRTIVDKVITYENQLESNWFHIGMGIADSQRYNYAIMHQYGIDYNYDENTHGVVEANWEHMRIIRSKLLLGHYSSVLEYYDGSQGLLDDPGDPDSSAVISSINTGISLINYAGHGLVDRWETSNLKNSDILVLENQNKLPFIFSVACLVGELNNDSTPCFAETWLRAKSPTTGNPTGCIGFYGASVEQWFNEPMDAQDSFNEQLIDEDYVTIGMLCYSSACDMMDNYMYETTFWRAKDMFNTWILFGDPSLNIIPNNNVGKTLFLEGEIDADTTFIKDYINVRDATIKNNADIIINHHQNTIFNGVFKVEIGSTLLVE